ncbi:MAG: hypothetical protein HKN47_24705 [Pirellulaceae bacterium]|nr:hypothetical protein [Pirellulaceae bacterium]
MADAPDITKRTGSDAEDPSAWSERITPGVRHHQAIHFCMAAAAAVIARAGEIAILDSLGFHKAKDHAVLDVFLTVLLLTADAD